MKLKLSAETIYWGTVFTSSSNNKILYRKLRKQNRHSFVEFFPFYLFMKDTRTIDLSNDELQVLIDTLNKGTQNSYIDHADACVEALRDISLQIEHKPNN